MLPSPLMNHGGTLLRELREAAGLTQAELRAKLLQWSERNPDHPLRIGRGRAWLSQLEIGRNPCPVDLLFLVEELTGQRLVVGVNPIEPSTAAVAIEKQISELDPADRTRLLEIIAGFQSAPADARTAAWLVLRGHIPD